jgi:hypothetical protein
MLLLTAILSGGCILMYDHRPTKDVALERILKGGRIMKSTNYEDALALERLLGLDADYIWGIIRGTQYLFASELIVAVLNHRFPSYGHRTVAQGMGAAS